MKQFDIPEMYRSPIIGKVKEIRKNADPRKKDFSPSVLNFGDTSIIVARHFGFCYGVENAIEIAYKAINENPGKQIYLLSQMIHNPIVNDDLQSYGIRFIMDTMGNQLIPWETLNQDDIVIIPAFGTSLEIEEKLKSIGIETQAYNTTCPFVEKVWKRASKLGSDDYSIIIHGKPQHEETRATFSHSKAGGGSIVIKDMSEAILIGDFMRGQLDLSGFNDKFEGRYSENFNPKTSLLKVGVVNQTTMLAEETQAIATYFRDVMIELYGEENIKDHFADTRDTLCYATNDNQSATKALLEIDADCAFVVGGYNSSNTTHLVELLEQKFPCYFINSDACIHTNSVDCFDIHSKSNHTLPIDFNHLNKIVVTSGASCPDAEVDRVINKILEIKDCTVQAETALNDLEKQITLL